MKEWFTVKELIKSPTTSETERSVQRRAIKESWASRKKNKGKGYEYHISNFSPATQAALIRQQLIDEEPQKPKQIAYGSESLWMRWDRVPESQKKEAQRRLEIMYLVEKLMHNGNGKTDAIKLAAELYDITRATYYNWEKSLKPYERGDWLPALITGHAGRTKHAECTDEAWEFFKADYLRKEKPTIAACYHRLERVAAEHGWTIPAKRTINRWIDKRIPIVTQVLMREGEHAVMNRYPALERSVKDLHALQWINGDGYQHNVFVRWPNGEIARPKTWFWQDIYSRTLLTYRVDVSENTDQIRQSFGDLVEQYGIPEHATIDNTRAAANKWMTGRVKNRYRFKIKDSDPEGLFPALGVKVHWTSVLFGKGHGQAKPIERAFGQGGLGEYVDKHPAFTGAYTGDNPMAKPDNYGEKAIPLEIFLRVLNEEIIAWNARAGRNTEICAGKLSYINAFNQSYANAPIRKATAEQRRLWLLMAEAITVKKDGTFTLEAGGKTGVGKNRYSAPELQELGERNKKIIIRFDPDCLHETVYCYTLDNRYICEAVVIDATGFGDTRTGREHKKARTQFVKATKAAAKAENIMDVLEVAEKLIPPELPDPVANKVSRMAIRSAPLETPKPKQFTPTLAEQEAQQAAGIEVDNIINMKPSPQEEETDIDRYSRWLELEQRFNQGDNLNEEENRFYTYYQDTPEFDTTKTLVDMGMLKLQG